MSGATSQITKSDFLATTAKAELERLRHQLALERGVLRSQRRSGWGDDRSWKVKKVFGLRATKHHIKTAATALIDFIFQHEWILGEVPNQGRLCFDCFTGGQPIDTHYCQLPEGHSGHHQNSAGCWNRQPKHPITKKAQARIAALIRENTENRKQFGEQWGTRQGPSILLYRDTHWYQHPMRRSFSCLGCEYLNFSDCGSPRCAHPEMLARYEVPQAVAGEIPKCLIGPSQCPALNNEANLTQPYPAPLVGRDSEYLSYAKVFKPFDGMTRNSQTKA